MAAYCVVTKTKSQTRGNYQAVAGKNQTQKITSFASFREDASLDFGFNSEDWCSSRASFSGVFSACGSICRLSQSVRDFLFRRRSFKPVFPSAPKSQNGLMAQKKASIKLAFRMTFAWQRLFTNAVKVLV
jgi:hypothetical protein